MNCDHDFIVIANIEKPEVIEGVHVVCAYCGHARQVFSNGDVLILSESGKVKRELPYEHPHMAEPK